MANVARIAASALGAGLPATLLRGHLLMLIAGAKPLALYTETPARIWTMNCVAQTAAYARGAGLLMKRGHLLMLLAGVKPLTTLSETTAKIWTINSAAQIAANALGAGHPTLLNSGTILMRLAGVSRPVRLPFLPKLNTPSESTAKIWTMNCVAHIAANAHGAGLPTLPISGQIVMHTVGARLEDNCY